MIIIDVYWIIANHYDILSKSRSTSSSGTIFWTPHPFINYLINSILSILLLSSLIWSYNDLKDVKYFKISLTEFFPTPGIVLMLSPKMCCTVRFDVLPLLRVNSSRVPKDYIFRSDYILFLIVYVIKCINLTDSLMVLTWITLNSSFTLVFSKAPITYLSLLALFPVRWPSNK